MAFEDNVDVYRWFVESPVRDGFGLWELGPGLVILAILLGYGIFTDLRGRIIPNQITVPLMVAALAVGPLLYDEPSKLLLAALLPSLFFVALVYTGGFGAGDTKLLIGLAFLFHKAILGIFFLAGFVAFVYALPVMFLARRARKRGEFEGRIRKIKLQFGPAIAVSTAVPVAVSGGGWWGLAYLAVMLASTLTFAAFSKGPVADALEEAEHAVAPLEGEESTELLTRLQNGFDESSGEQESDESDDKDESEVPDAGVAVVAKSTSRAHAEHAEVVEAAEGAEGKEEKRQPAEGEWADRDQLDPDQPAGVADDERYTEDRYA